MARPFLKCPDNWLRGSLEANHKLGLIAKVDSGSTPSTTSEEYWDGNLPWLTPKEITEMIDSIYVSKTERTITPKGLSNSSAKLLPPGTVMLTKRAPVGAVVINAVPMATNQGFLNFQCGPNLRPIYLAYWFKVNKIYLDMVANGSTYPELYKSDLFEFEISVPSLSEQDNILSIISALQYVSLLGLPLEQSVSTSEEMLRMQELNRRLRTIRDAILPKLLSGQFNVSDIKTRFSEVFYNGRNVETTTLWGEQLPAPLWS